MNNQSVESFHQSCDSICGLRKYQTEAIPDRKYIAKRRSEQFHASVSLSSLVVADPPRVDFRIHNARRTLAYLVMIASRVLEPIW